MCIYKCMLNVYKNQQSQQAGSRNLMCPKALPMIWGTSMMLVKKYQISAVNRYWEKCDDKYHEWTEGRKDGRTDGRNDGQTERGKTVCSPPPSGSGGILRYVLYCLFYHTPIYNDISLSVVKGFLFSSYQSPMSLPLKTGYTPRYVDRLVTNIEWHLVFGYVRVLIFNLPITSELTFFLNRIHAKRLCSIGQYIKLFCIGLDSER
jgi:hypothetical protein